MYITIALLQLMFLLSMRVICCKNKKPRLSRFQHSKERIEILVKCQTFRAAMTIQKSALIIIY